MGKNYFYGIYGIRFICHGEWANPELIWHGHTFDYYDVETPLYETFREECDDDDMFPVWVKQHASLVRDVLSNLLQDAG